MTGKLPQGYTQAPADYTGEVYIESQMRWMYDQGYDDGFIVGAEKGRNISEEIKAAKREALLEAADMCGESRWTELELRQLAEELK